MHGKVPMEGTNETSEKISWSIAFRQDSVVITLMTPISDDPDNVLKTSLIVSRER